MAEHGDRKSKLRLLVGKVGLDGHDRGVKIVARALRDAGHEVIYTGLHQTPEMVVATAVQEVVDAVSLSILSGAHKTLFPRVIQLLRKAKLSIPVFGGGIIPEEDIPFLKKSGVRAVFTPGTTTSEVTEWVAKNIRPRTQAPSRVPVRRPVEPGKRSVRRRPRPRG
jgi:methylmalonyl-CoA mutase C-terminal domain/subunit